METIETHTRFRGVSRTYTGVSSNFELPSPSYDSSRKGNRKKDKPDVLCLIAVLLFTLLVYSFVRYVDFKVPVPLTVSDAKNSPLSFIEERARNDLITLTSVGPRVAGSHANDVLTVDFLLRIIQEIQRTKLSVHNVEYDVQKPVGSFHMGFQDGLTSSYSNIPNVVVKLSSANSRVNDSILVNCHFDSVPGSPGASDDMISCAVMLETIRVLSRQPTPLRNNIIYLFNGAEENLLQGAHGFINGKTEGSNEAGHRWSKHLKTFVNLEGAGAGAREILFQTGPGNGWLLESYRKVPYPWGSVVGEEIFQKGLIPSDTDFRIFRDFANIPGLDMAFVKNGYVYHTKFDNVDNINPGSLQHEGSNVIALLLSMGNIDFSKIEFSDTKMVFFDVFGYFMIVYSERVAVVFNLIVGILALAISWNEVDRKVSTMSWLILSTLGAWTAGILCSLIFGLLLNVFHIYSPYHSYPMSVFLIFGIPCVAAQVATYSLALKGSEDFTWIAGKTTLALILVLSTFFTRIVFSITFNLLFGIAGWYIARQLFKGLSPSLGYKLRLAFYLLVGEAFPMALSIYLVVGCLDTFVPIMGRSGSDSNPNLFLAALTSVTLTIPTISGIVPVFVFFRKTFLRGCAVAMLLVVGVIIFVIGRVPYQDSTPMRVHLIEVDRSFYEADLTTVTKRDAGFWYFNVDPNIPMFYDILGENIPEMNHENHEEIDAYTCESLYCGLPFIFPVKKLIRKSHFIPKKNLLPDHLTSRIRMDITQDSYITNDVRRVTFSFIGPDHLTINFSPGENYDISKWSLTDKVPKPMSVLWKGRPTYFVYHGRGINFERFNVTIDFKKKATASDTANTLVDINYASFYLHGDEMKSRDLIDFSRRLPSWTYVLGFSGVSHVYSIPG